MGYSQDQGYTPSDITSIMTDLMEYINGQFSTTYTYETFVGTNFYKNFYALAQKMQENEVKTSEIFIKLQNYFIMINAMISRPVVTSPGIIEKLKTEGYIASVKPMIEADAGKINICVDLDETADDYAETKIELCTLISQITIGGGVTQGTETETIVISNGQSFDFKYHLPNRIPVFLRLTTTLSENNQVLIGSPDDVKETLMTNIGSRYRLGKNFEPQKYFSVSDAPWASDVVLEWTDDLTGGELDETPTWNATVYDAAFDDLFDYALDRILLVEA